jgi:hypothetical protein
MLHDSVLLYFIHNFTGKDTGVTEILLLIELMVVTKEVQNSEGHLLLMGSNHCPNDTNIFEASPYVFFVTFADCSAVRSRCIV